MYYGFIGGSFCCRSEDLEKTKSKIDLKTREMYGTVPAIYKDSKIYIVLQYDGEWKEVTSPKECTGTNSGILPYNTPPIPKWAASIRGDIL